MATQLYRKNKTKKRKGTHTGRRTSPLVKPSCCVCSRQSCPRAVWLIILLLPTLHRVLLNWILSVLNVSCACGQDSFALSVAATLTPIFALFDIATPKTTLVGTAFFYCCTVPVRSSTLECVLLSFAKVEPDLLFAVTLTRTPWYC